MPRRSFSLVVVSILGSLWALALAVLGFHAAFAQKPFFSLAEPVVRLAGVSGVAAAQFVFMVLVADRWFLRASRTLTLRAELGALGVFLASGAGAAWLVFFGAAS